MKALLVIVALTVLSVICAEARVLDRVTVQHKVRSLKNMVKRANAVLDMVRTQAGQMGPFATRATAGTPSKETLTRRFNGCVASLHTGWGKFAALVDERGVLIDKAVALISKAAAATAHANQKELADFVKAVDELHDAMKSLLKDSVFTLLDLVLPGCGTAVTIIWRAVQGVDAAYDITKWSVTTVATIAKKINAIAATTEQKGEEVDAKNELLEFVGTADTARTAAGLVTSIFGGLVSGITTSVPGVNLIVDCAKVIHKQDEVIAKGAALQKRWSNIAGMLAEVKDDILPAIKASTEFLKAVASKAAELAGDCGEVGAAAQAAQSELAKIVVSTPNAAKLVTLATPMEDSVH